MESPRRIPVDIDFLVGYAIIERCCIILCWADIEQPCTRDAVLGELNLAIVYDKVLKVVEKAADAVLKCSEDWSIGQKVGASLVCMLAAEHRF